MKTANIYPKGLFASNYLHIQLMVYLINILYNTGIQFVTTPPHLANASWKRLAGINWKFAGCYHEGVHNILFRNQFVRCCTTKYIFWIGKNKFDDDCRHKLTAFLIFSKFQNQ